MSIYVFSYTRLRIYVFSYTRLRLRGYHEHAYICVLIHLSAYVFSYTRLRQGGYHEHAYRLALSENEVEMCVKILVMDLKQPAKALDFVSSIPRAECMRCIKTHARELLAGLCYIYIYIYIYML